MTLTDIGIKYNTDKANWHNYTPIYEKYFDSIKNNNIKLLEIGVDKGASLRMWREYFANGKIYGFDIRRNPHIYKDNFEIYIGNQSNRDDLKGLVDKYGGGFDVIIDDGGHKMNEQQISFGFLFPYLKSGGLYVIEDLHTSFNQQYEKYGVYHDFSNTTYNMLKWFNKKGKIISEYLTDSEMMYLEKNIKQCDIYIPNNNKKQDIIGFIRKK